MDTIYYDRDDDDMDGLGWNVVSNGGSIAARFATKDDAVAWCEDHGVPYELVHGQCDCGYQYTLGADDHCGECGSCWGCCECCKYCGGSGRWESTTEDSPTTLVDLGPCPECVGTGAPRNTLQPGHSPNTTTIKLEFTEINILIILLDDFLENPMSSNINPTYIKKLEVLRKTLDNALPGDEGPYIEYPQH